jgi:hypothetical protein
MPTPVMYPTSTGFDRSCARKPRRSAAPTRATAPTSSASMGISARVAGRVARAQRGDGGGGEDGGARLGPDAEVARGADEGVHHGRQERRGEAHVRGESRELGVGHALRHEHRAHGEARHEVGA